MKKIILLFSIVFVGFLMFTGQKVDDNPRWSQAFTHLYPSSNFVLLPILPDKNVSFSNSPRYVNTPNGILTVNPSVRVLPSTTYAQTELPIASNKANRNVLFGSSNNVDMSGPTINSGCFVSTNNGVTWGGYQVINSNNPNDQRGDPGPAVDKNMNFIFSHLTSTTNFGGVTGIGCNYSSNYGANWSNTFQVESSSSADKNLSNTDDSPISPYYGYSYTAWCVLTSPSTSRFARTTNYGVNWETQTLATTTTSYNAQGHDIACGPNGEVYVVWNTTSISSPYNGLFIAVAKSTNGGANFTANQYAITINGARDNGTYGGWGIRANDFPRIDVDKSGGSYNGWIYIVSMEKNLSPAGTDPDVVLYRSSNGGTSWMTGVRVNQDAVNNGKYQYFPAVKVDDYGGVNIIYYDNRNFANADSATVMISRSLDGGATFTDFEITDHHFKPKPANGMSGGYMGDYIGLAIGNNKVYGFWMDDKAGVAGFYNAWTGSFDLGPAITHTPLTNTEQISGTRAVNCIITSAGAPIVTSLTKLFVAKNAGAFDSVQMTNPSGNNWTANITLSGAGTYKYYIRTVDNSNRPAYAPAGAPANFYSFTAAVDVTPPVITHTPIGLTPKPYWPITVNANVTDNLGVDSVWVEWYKNTPSVIKEFKLLPVGSNNYSAAFNSLNSDVVVGDIIYYHIKSLDISINKNIASLPSGYYAIGITAPPVLCEGFNTATFPPTGWTLTGTQTSYWSYNAVSGYGLGTGSGRFNFYNLTSGSAQLVTYSFAPSVALDSIRFTLAHAYYSSSYIDTLKIESSTNGGTNWTNIWTLWSQTSFTDPNSLSTISTTGSFVPSSTDWKSMVYALPVGTNKLRFNAISGFGNDMFIDSICYKSAPVSSLTLGLTAMLSGICNGTTMNYTKNCTVELHNQVPPYSLVESKTVTLNTSGVGNPVYTTAVTGTPYYIVLKTDNGLETWSAAPQIFSGSTLNYDFTSAATQAYNSNMILVGTEWCIISGDVNQDGSIDASDRSACWNDRNLSGVYVTDLNGDGTVDAVDRSIAWNNRNVSIQKPALAASPGKVVYKGNKKDKSDLKLDGSKAKKAKSVNGDNPKTEKNTKNK